MGMFPNACFLALGYNCCAQVMGVLYFLANPTDLQELEEGLHILANLSDVNQALGIYFCNRIKKVTCGTPDHLTLHRLCVSMLAVPQRFVWQVMLPSLFYNLFGNVYCKNRAFGCNLDSNDFDWQFELFSY